MKYIIAYDWCAILLYLAIFSYYLWKKRMLDRKSNIFGIMIVVGFLATVFDMVNAYEFNYTKGDLMGLTISCTLNFIFQNVIMFLFAYYTSYNIDMDTGNKPLGKKVILYGPIAVLLLFDFTNVFTKLVFYYDSYGNYHRGPLMSLHFLVGLYYIVLCAYLLVIYKGNMKAKSLFAPICLIVLNFSAFAVQMLWPNHLILGYDTAISVLLFLLVVQKPSEMLDNEFDVFNKNEIFSYMQIVRTKKRKCTLIILHVDDYRLLHQTIGNKRMKELIRQIAEYLKTYEEHRVFKLDDRILAFVTDEIDPFFVDELMEKVHDRFDAGWSIQGILTYVSARTLALSLPADVPDPETFDMYLDHLKELDQSKQWKLWAKDINLVNRTRILQVENALHDAIRNERFEVYYQPIYNVNEDRITSAEALVRLKDPVLGEISPAEFIPISEKDGMILSIGSIVFEKVCRFMQESGLHDEGLEYIEVNISIVQCMQEYLAEEFIEIMERYDIETGRVNLEVTETAAFTSPKLLSKNMKRLVDQGMKFSLDDYGTGNSNLNSILELPLDMIKLDKSMIDTVMMDERGFMVVDSSVSMVKKLGMKVVAEGVEKKEQVDVLSRMGVDYLQGYYFSKPIPQDELLDYIRKFNN